MTCSLGAGIITACECTGTLSMYKHVYILSCNGGTELTLTLDVCWEQLLLLHMKTVSELTSTSTCVVDCYQLWESASHQCLHGYLLLPPWLTISVVMFCFVTNCYLFLLLFFFCFSFHHQFLKFCSDEVYDKTSWCDLSSPFPKIRGVKNFLKITSYRCTCNCCCQSGSCARHGLVVLYTCTCIFR